MSTDIYTALLECIIMSSKARLSRKKECLCLNLHQKPRVHDDITWCGDDIILHS